MTKKVISKQIATVVAKDKKGNEFQKEVVLYKYEDQDWIISFGWPCEYYFESLKRYCPFKKGLVIDMMGRNHKGIPDVMISSDQMDCLMKQAGEEILKLEKEVN